MKLIDYSPRDEDETSSSFSLLPDDTLRGKVRAELINIISDYATIGKCNGDKRISDQADYLIALIRGER